MSNNQKQQLIAEVVSLLNARISAMEKPAPQATRDTLEMLTIKECADCIKGLSAHTIRLLVKQGKIPSVRTGAGQSGKILVSKSALLAYFNEVGGVA
jgi:excisionase family DNA binding protein